MSAKEAAGEAGRLKRRKFSDAFKRKLVAEAARTSNAAVVSKYKLPGSFYQWQFKPSKTAAKEPKANGKAVQLGPQREAIVYLKHAERAFAAGKDRRGKLLSGLALSTLLGE